MELEATTSDTANVSSSVPASAFGWDFQVNAAIVLMLINIKQADSVKTEGSSDDIEIYLDNGNIIYSQAKAVFDRDNFKPVDRNLEKSLKSLYNDSLKSNVEKLVYIANSPNPFNNQNTMYAFSSGLNPYDYSGIPSPCKNKIDRILKKNNYSIDVDKLSVYVLQFSADMNNRYKVIEEQVNKLINSFNLGIKDVGNDMLAIWQNDFFITFRNQSIIYLLRKQKCYGRLLFLCVNSTQMMSLLNALIQLCMTKLNINIKQ